MEGASCERMTTKKTQNCPAKGRFRAIELPERELGKKWRPQKKRRREERRFPVWSRERKTAHTIIPDWSDKIKWQWRIGGKKGGGQQRVLRRSEKQEYRRGRKHWPDAILEGLRMT